MFQSYRLSDACKMNKQTLNTGGIIGLIIVIYGMYLLLLHDKMQPLSIDAMQAVMNHWARHWRILAVGLLPIYVGLVFFGAAVSGVSFGSALQRWLVRVLRQ
jgi:hypothetical protein